MSISLNTLKRNYQNQFNTDSDTMHEYFNMEAVNEYTPNNTQPLPLVFNQTKTYNVIGKADDYYLSIIRWNLQSNLPVLIPDINTSLVGPFDGQTIYEVGLAYSYVANVPSNLNEFAFVSANGPSAEVSIISASVALKNPLPYLIPAASYLNQYVAYDNLSSTVGTIYYVDGTGIVTAANALNGNSLYILNVTPSGLCADIVNGNFYYFTGSASRAYKQVLRTGSAEWVPQVTDYTSTVGLTFSCCAMGNNLYEVTYSPNVVINQWTISGGGGAPTTSVTVDSGSFITAQMVNDGTNIYIYVANTLTATLYKYSSALAQLATLDVSTYTVPSSLPICGFDNSGNLIISYLNGGLNFLLFITTSTLTVNTTQSDVFSTGNSTVVAIPLNLTVTETKFVQAGDVQNLVFIPETINTSYASALNYPTDKEQLYNNPYFYIKYVDTFCRMLNIAIQNSFASITGATWATLPYFQWNAVDQKIQYYYPNSSPTGVTPIPPTGAIWYVICNQPLYALLNTFRFKYYPKNANNGLIFPESCPCRYVLDANILQNAEPSGEYNIYTQQVSSVQTWSPVQSIVFQSTIIPIEPQLTGQPQNLNTTDPTTQGNIYKQQALTKVLTDFVFPLTTGTEITNQELYYIPSGEYRLVDLLGGNSITQLTFAVLWKDKFGVLHPMTIDAGSSASLLCLLRKKNYKHIGGF